MNFTEHGIPGPDFDARLKAALDRAVPPTPHFAFARYRSSIPKARLIRRLAPALAGIAAVGITAISATAATGSTNPAVWTQRAASSIELISHPKPKPVSTHSPKPQPSQAGGQGQGPVRSTPWAIHDGRQFGPWPAHRPAPTRHHHGSSRFGYGYGSWFGGHRR